MGGKPLPQQAAKSISNIRWNRSRMHKPNLRKSKDNSFKIIRQILLSNGCTVVQESAPSHGVFSMRYDLLMRAPGDRDRTIVEAKPYRPSRTPSVVPQQAIRQLEMYPDGSVIPRGIPAITSELSSTQRDVHGSLSDRIEIWDLSDLTAKAKDDPVTLLALSDLIRSIQIGPIGSRLWR
jgi:hypothetical protein